MINLLYRLAAGVLVATALFFSTYVKDEGKMLPPWFYCILLFVFNLRNVSTPRNKICFDTLYQIHIMYHRTKLIISVIQVLKYLIGVTLGTLCCRVSDARYGGMYMTLWGSVVNLGANWSITMCLWGVDPLTIKNCAKVSKLRCDQCIIIAKAK